MTQLQLSNTFANRLHQQILKICHTVPLRRHENKFGPKLFQEFQRVALVTLFRRSKKVLRDFIAELPELRWIQWLGLRELPAKSTLNDWCKKYSTSFTRKLNQLLLSHEHPELMAFDATGVDSWQRSRHYEKRIGASPMPYAKLYLLADLKTQLLHDHVLRMKPRHDTIGVKSMLRRTHHKNVLFLGDKAHDSEPLHEEAVASGNRLYSPVRKSTRKKPRGFYRRQCVQEHPLYTKRNIIESTIRSFKTKRGDALRSKLPHMKKREAAWLILIHNLEKTATALQRLLQGVLNLRFRTEPK